MILNWFGLLIFTCFNLSAVSSPISKDQEALNYCQEHDQIYIMVVWPRAVDRINDIRSMLSNGLAQNGAILYEKSFKLSNSAPTKLFLVAHPHWPYDVAESMRHYIPNLIEPPYHLYSFLFESRFPLAEIVKLKKVIRDQIGMDWWSIHINDTTLEAQDLAKLIFDDSSLAQLNQ